MTERVKNITKEDWRRLGFYYERDDVIKKWILIGSKVGLKKFCTILEKYTKDKKNQYIGEHQHLGPYYYLKIMTRDSFRITSDYIAGTLDDLKQLNVLLKTLIESTQDKDLPTSKMVVDNFLGKSDYMIEMQLMEHGYDPASADVQLW